MLRTAVVCLVVCLTVFGQNDQKAKEIQSWDAPRVWVAADAAVAQQSGGFLQFRAVQPCRLLDTRNPNGPFGGPEIGAGQTRSIPVPTSNCGIPATARAYSLNVTVVPAKVLGYLTVWPTGQAQPFVSTLNSPDGAVLANAAVVPAGTGGAISVFVTDATHVVIDINGYFDAGGAAPLSFYAIAPCRLVDTRPNGGTIGAFGPPTMGRGATRTIPVPASPCGISPAAQAYSLNFTVVPREPLSYLTAWPTGIAQPLVSTLNAQSGTIVANAAIVPAGTSGAINIYTTNTTEVVIDINGFFAP